MDRDPDDVRFSVLAIAPTQFWAQSSGTHDQTSFVISKRFCCCNDNSEHHHYWCGIPYTQKQIIEFWVNIFQSFTFSFCSSIICIFGCVNVFFGAYDRYEYLNSIKKYAAHEINVFLFQWIKQFLCSNKWHLFLLLALRMGVYSLKSNW